jgi:hypothetical protein
MRGNDSRESSTLWTLFSENTELCTTGVIIGELIIGMKSDAKRERLKEDMATLHNLPADDPEDYIKAGEIYVACKKAGITVKGFMDCLIAAIAIKHSALLFHKDRDFDLMKTAIPQLRLLKV